MTSRVRFVAHVALLLFALVPMAGMSAGHADCDDDCRAICGNCILCCPAGLLAAAAKLAPPPSGARSFVALATTASAVVPRAIEHVPLRRA